MVKIIWTQRSINDLNSIAEYISQDSVKYAKLILEGIINTTKYLESHPRIGRKVPEMIKNEKFREIIYGNYRIIYKISNAATIIYILTICHCAKKLRQTVLTRTK